MNTINQMSDRQPRKIGIAAGRKDLRTAVAIAAPALLGLLTALIMPHGSITSAQVWLVMGAGLLAGLVAGFALRSPWAILLAPLTAVILFEIIRPTGAVPTIGALRLDNPYGILAFLMGRGFYGLVALLPLALGAGAAVWFTRYQAGAFATPGRAAWQAAPLLLLAALVAALTVWNGVPAATPPLLNEAGEPVAGSIAELTEVTLGGQEQTILVRGRSADLPVLLYLSGGPGQSDLPYSRVLFADLTEEFIVVSWDQRGTGKSYPALYPTADVTLDQAISDTIELTNYLRDRFDEEKIYLLGESWGSTLGVLAVQQRPDLYYAWIGSGQMVSQRETDRRIYHDLLALAERTGDADLQEQLRVFGEPPYADVPYPNAVVMGLYAQLETPYRPPQDYIDRGTAANLGPWGIMGSEYRLVEKVNVMRGLIDMFTLMYPQLQEIDFREDVPRLEVPVYILDGAAELPARRDLMLEWYAQLDAPQKELYTFENSGHSVAFEQFAALQEIVTETVLPQTYPAR